MSEAVTLNTIGKLREHSHRLGITCLGCGRYREADLDSLIARYGEDAPPRHPFRLVCTRCGGHRYEITIVAPTPFSPEYGR
jgi:hypothetical protein